MIEPKIVQKEPGLQQLGIFVYLLFLVDCQISYPIKDLHVRGRNIPV